MKIVSYQREYETQVIALWQACGLTRAWNNPQRDIERKLAEQPELFLLGVLDGQLIATAMAGYDGHRGWVSYLGVLPEFQQASYGKQMMTKIEQLLSDRGCPKLNLQIRADNEQVIRFYQSLGYQVEEVVSMGKRLIPD